MVGYQHVVQTPRRVNCGGLSTAWTLHDIISKPVLNQFKLWTWINFQIKIADYSLKHLQECRMTWRKRKKRTGMKQKWSCRSQVGLRLVFKEFHPFSGKVTWSFNLELNTNFSLGTIYKSCSFSKDCQSKCHLTLKLVKMENLLPLCANHAPLGIVYICRVFLSQKLVLPILILGCWILLHHI